MRFSVANEIKKAPHKPGVYIFYGKNKKALYVGKAADLKARLRSYLKISDYKTELLSREAVLLKLIILRSEIEALLEESRLIKTERPTYNVMWRDDKSYFYVVFTKEKFPRIFITHAGSIPELKNSEVVGPFTEGRALRITLRLLRRNFPFCTCKYLHFRNCLNAEIGNCSGFCCKKGTQPTAKETARYRRNVKIIKNFLLGRTHGIALKNLKADERRALEYVLVHKPFLVHYNASPEMTDDSSFRRAECYDISHLAGKETVGAMTAWLFKNGVWTTNKTLWRRFKIKSAKPGDDPGAIYEVISRRFNHPEWPYPDLIIIDGGVTQLHAAKKALITKNLKLKTLKVISFAKPQKSVWGWSDAKKIPLHSLPEGIQKLILRAIAETHRFAITYHRHMRRRMLLKA